MPMNIVIQEQRKLLGLTQEQVADYLGVSTPAVSKWEKGITSPDIGLLPPLARLLKIDLNGFCQALDGEENEHMTLFICPSVIFLGQPCSVEQNRIENFCSFIQTILVQ